MYCRFKLFLQILRTTSYVKLIFSSFHTTHSLLHLTYWGEWFLDSIKIDHRFFLGNLAIGGLSVTRQIRTMLFLDLKTLAYKCNKCSALEFESFLFVSHSLLFAVNLLVIALGFILFVASLLLFYKFNF